MKKPYIVKIEHVDSKRVVVYAEDSWEARELASHLYESGEINLDKDGEHEDIVNVMYGAIPVDLETHDVYGSDREED